ncbi:hypothetical protein ACFPM0_34615 [Pseudonocardia sulfidoxydans]|uniref:hypothetical protein n=1 Tax=Pseudonocardia sulfidoxydans TaxID=54011 RepID=UPI0036179C3C
MRTPHPCPVQRTARRSDADDSSSGAAPPARARPRAARYRGGRADRCGGVSG